MKKLLLIFLLLLTACSHIEPVKLKEDVTIELYTVLDCGECEAFKKNAVPYFKEIFEDQVVINIYDLDDKDTESIYDKQIKLLEDFDEEYYGHGPMICIPGYFALLGYMAGDEELIAQDIINIQNNKDMTNDLDDHRYHYKKEGQS